MTWTKTYGGIENDKGNSIAPTIDGGFIITGERQLTTNGYYDVYILRVDSIGDTLWTKTYGGAQEEKGFSGIQTTDGGFIFSGKTQTFASGLSNGYLIHTDNNGDTLWTKTYGGYDYDECRSAYETSDGGFILGGMIWGYGPGALDFYLIKTDSNGNSGCLDSSTNTISYNGITIISTGLTIQSTGGTISTPPFTSVNPPTIDTLLCGTVSSINEPVTTQQVTLQFYPNPFRTYFTLEFRHRKNEKYILNLYNSLGQLVRQIDNITTGQIRIERGNLTNGLHFFQLRTDSEIIGHRKFIIE